MWILQYIAHWCFDYTSDCGEISVCNNFNSDVTVFYTEGTYYAQLCPF